MSVRNGSQLTGVPWDLRLAGPTSATHTFLVLIAILISAFLNTQSFDIGISCELLDRFIVQYIQVKNVIRIT